MGVVAIVEPRPEIDFPGFAPARAAIAPEFEGFAGRSRQIGCGERGNLPARMQTK